MGVKMPIPTELTWEENYYGPDARSQYYHKTLSEIPPAVLSQVNSPTHGSQFKTSPSDAIWPQVLQASIMGSEVFSIVEGVALLQQVCFRRAFVPIYSSLTKDLGLRKSTQSRS